MVFVCEGRLLIACWHTEKRRGRRLSWLLKHISHRGTVVRGATEVVCKLYLKLYAQGIYAKVIRNQFASSPLLFVPSAPPCITYNSVHSVSQCALLCNRLGLGLHITEGLFLLAYWFFYGKQLISLTTEDVNYFHSSQNQYMLFRGLKDALLACKRCPFEVLLTPF